MSQKISVVIPTFNREHIISETLDSVLRQTYENWECLVIDDGSSDNTEAILAAYQEKDTRFKFIKRTAERKKGANSCRNIGVENATGDYIQFLDSDDLVAPDKFEEQIKKLEKASKDAIATCKWGGINMKKARPSLYHGLPTYFNSKKPIELLSVFGNRFTHFPPHVFLIPKHVIIQAGPWKEDLLINQDGEFLARVILNSSEIVFCENTFVLYRSGSGNRTTGFIATEEGKQHYIRSLNLIDESIQKYADIKNHIYVKQRKSQFYYKLKNLNKFEMIKANTQFFKGRASDFNYFFHRFTSGLKTKLNKSAEKIDF